MDTRRFRIIVVALALGMGCATNAHFSDTWKDPEYAGPMTRVLVVTMNKNATQRRLWEDAMAASLEERGVRGVPSHRLFSGMWPDSIRVVEAVERDGYDGLIVSSRLDTELKNREVPGQFESQPVVVYDPQRGQYYTRFVYTMTEEHTESEMVMRHRIEVFTTKEDGRLVWTGVGEVINPTSSDQVRNEINDLLAPELTKRGILPPLTRKPAAAN